MMYFPLVKEKILSKGILNIIIIIVRESFLLLGVYISNKEYR